MSEMEPIAAIMIDPWTKRVDETQLPNTDNLSQYLGCHYISFCNLGHGLQMIIDDMGALPPDQGGPKVQRFFRLPGIMRGEPPVGGRALIIAFDLQGETRNVYPHTVTLIRECIEWPELHAAGVARSEGIEKHPEFGEVKVFKTEIKFAEGNRD